MSDTRHALSTTCPCHATSKSSRILCRACVRRALHTAHERRTRAYTEWAEARQSFPLNATNQQLGALQDSSRRWRARLEFLQRRAAQAAVEVCAAAVEEEQRRTAIANQRVLPEESLARWQACLQHSEGAMVQAVTDARCRVRGLRFRWACAAIALHRLQVEEKDAKDNSKQARGIGKIGGLPLPHAGPELYGVLPADELQSALRLVASVTISVARCLAIWLPHPILLGPSASQDDIAAHVVLPENSFPAGDCAKEIFQNSKPDDMSSSSILFSIAERMSSASRQLRMLEPTAGAPPLSNNTVLRSTTSTPPTPDPAHARLQRSRAAVLAENSSSKQTTSYYALEPKNAEDFSIALQLLQNNVICLCIRAGVPVAQLWPAEAILLNLHSLQVFCQSQVESSSSSS